MKAHRSFVGHTSMIPNSRLFQPRKKTTYGSRAIHFWLFFFLFYFSNTGCALQFKTGYKTHEITQTASIPWMCLKSLCKTVTDVSVVFLSSNDKNYIHDDNESFKKKNQTKTNSRQYLNNSVRPRDAIVSRPRDPSCH